MSNRLIYSFTNPLQIFSNDPDRPEKYNSKDFEDYEFSETILPWQQYTGYCQPFQLNDTISLQLQTNVGPVNFILKDWLTGRTINTIQFDQVLQNLADPTLFIYEVSVPLNIYDEGHYYVVIQFGSFELRTGKIELSELHETTLLFEYKHYENREDLIFETGFFPSVRVPGVKEYLGPKNKSTTYEDQIANVTALRNIKYRQWKLFIGLDFGIPDYFADMIGGISGCSDFRIDGKSYTVPSDTGMEANKIEGVALRWWAIEPIREKYARSSRTFENDEPLDALVAVMVNSDSKGFGNSNSGSQTAVINVS